MDDRGAEKYRWRTVCNSRKQLALRLEDRGQSEQWGPSVEVGPWGSWWSEAESGEKPAGPPSLWGWRRRESSPCAFLGCPGICCPQAFLEWGAAARLWCPCPQTQLLVRALLSLGQRWGAGRLEQCRG